MNWFTFKLLQRKPRPYLVRVVHLLANKPVRAYEMKVEARGRREAREKAIEEYRKVITFDIHLITRI